VQKIAGGASQFFGEELGKTDWFFILASLQKIDWLCQRFFALLPAQSRVLLCDVSFVGFYFATWPFWDEAFFGRIFGMHI
jgi:hypothetical protein